MDLLIDGQALQTPDSRHRGIGRWSRNLVSALAAARPDWNIALVQNERLEAIEPAHTAGLPLLRFRPPLPTHPDSADANGRYYADWLLAQAPRRLLILSFFEHWATLPRFGRERPPLAGILYDVIPLLLHRQYLDTAVYAGSYATHFRRLLEADLLLSISEASARDLRALVPGDLPRLLTIGGATDPAFEPLPSAQLERIGAALKERLGLRREFFLYVGGWDFRKNMAGCLRAFAALPPECRAAHDLVITCALAPPDAERLSALGKELGIGDRLIVTGFVGDAELRALYQMCRLFLYPSLYEGLGLPVLEALQCGAPVVASNTAAVPEYAGPASWLADPSCPEEIAAAIVAALAEPRDARLEDRRAFASRFRWDHIADRALAGLETLGEPHLPATPRRKRIAWVSPLPPAPTGIADYSAELLGPLSERYEIDLVVDPAQPPVAAHFAAGHIVVPGPEVFDLHTRRPYDLFVYHLGNSPFHLYQLALLRHFSGLVVLHDFCVGWLVWVAQGAGLWPGALDGELEAAGEVQLAEWLRRGAIAAQVAAEMVPLNRGLLHTASAVVVHSAWSWQRLRREIDVPVTVVPHHGFNCPELGTARQQRQRLGLPEDDFLIVTLGQLSYTKRMPSLLHAVAELPAAVRDRTHVLIVGAGEAAQVEELRRLGKELGLGERVHLTGRVSLEDFWAYVRAADVCVQLRYPSRGETSGPLLRALAAGAACVTSDHATMAEFPDDVVWKVRSPHHEVEDLTRALHRLAASVEERKALGEAGRCHVAEHHALERVTARYVAVMEQTMARRAAADEDWKDQVLNALAHCHDPAAGEVLLLPWLSLREKSRQGSLSCAAAAVAGRAA